MGTARVSTVPPPSLKPRRGGRPKWFDPMPYLFIAPTVVVVALVFGYPVLSVLWNSFSVPALFGKSELGLDNYVAVLSNPIFHRALLNNLRLFLAVPVMTVLSVLIATLLFERVRGWRFYRSIVFIPYVIAIPVVGIVFSYILQRHGLLNELLEALHLGFLVRDWLGDSNWAIWAVWLVIVWQQLGFGVVLFLARLGGLDASLTEAAMLDRAGWWQRFWNVTVPHLATTIEFFVTLSLINMLSWVFNYVYVMTGGGPVQSTYVLELFVFNSAFRDGQPNIASAVSVIVLMVAVVLLSVQAFLRRRVERLEE